MRLYRGLKEPYQSKRRADGLMGVDFTDCPYVALFFASGRRGQVLVLDFPDDRDEMRVTSFCSENGRIGIGTQ